MPVTVTSDEVNYLIYRYLIESGFQHSAFTFGSESFINKTSINGSDVPPGALISFIQKGLQYLEVEAELQQSGEPVNAAPFGMFEGARPAVEQGDEDPMVCETAGADAPDFADVDISVLEGHKSEVFAVSWSPSGLRLASGSGDGKCIVWGDGSKSGPSSSRRTTVRGSDSTDGEKSDVTTVAWHPNGEQYVTGTLDGKCRMWKADGTEARALAEHTGPVFSAAYSPTGKSVLTASADGTAVVHDATSGEVVQTVRHHKGPVLDAAWRNDTQFATCSADTTVAICEVGRAEPLAILIGHQREINSLAWDPSGTVLASASDDQTARIWSAEKGICLHTLDLHAKEVYCVAFSPSGPGSRNPEKRSLLASGSFDGTAKLWDASSGECILTLGTHTQPVYDVAFSWCASFVATASLDHVVRVWDTASGACVRAYRARGACFKLAWRSTAAELAVAVATGDVVVLRVR